MVFLRFGFVGVLGTLVLFAAGCSKSGGFVPVTGTVKFEDGTPVKAEIATITFQSSGSGKGAQGDLQADGTFTLTTIDPGDGAAPGDYTVTVYAIDGYPDGKPVVSTEYMDVGSSPLIAKVTADGENKFDFTVKKP